MSVTAVQEDNKWQMLLNYTGRGKGVAVHKNHCSAHTLSFEIMVHYVQSVKWEQEIQSITVLLLSFIQIKHGCDEQTMTAFSQKSLSTLL